MEKEIGKVVHYFDKVGVAVIKLSAKLNVGDTVKFKKGEEEFSDTISSMQVEHESIQSGKAGEEVAVKVSGPVKEGTYVFKEE
jgi:translation initiation factor IF-2